MSATLDLSLRTSQYSGTPARDLLKIVSSEQSADFRGVRDIQSFFSRFESVLRFGILPLPNAT